MPSRHGSCEARARVESISAASHDPLVVGLDRTFDHLGLLGLSTKVNNAALGTVVLTSHPAQPPVAMARHDPLLTT